MKAMELLSKKPILGKELRIYGTEEKPLFLAYDVFEIIEEMQPLTMLSILKHDVELVKGTVLLFDIEKRTDLLTEQGLYEVLLESRSPIAKAFRNMFKVIISDNLNGKKLLDFIDYGIEFKNKQTDSINE